MRIARVVAAVAALTLSPAATASAQTFDPPGSTDAEYTGSPTEQTVIQALTPDGAGGYWGIDWADRAYCDPTSNLNCTTGGGGDGYGDSTLLRFDSALNIAGSGGSFQQGQGTPSYDIEQYFNSPPTVGGSSSHGIGGWVREWDETGGLDIIKLTVLPGKNAPLKVKLTKAQKKKLAKMRKKRVKAKITVTQGGQSQASTVVLPLDLKKK